jgi:hypothetical protein
MSVPHGAGTGFEGGVRDNHAALLRGEMVTHSGGVTTVDVKPYSLPKTPPLLIGAACHGSDRRARGWVGVWHLVFLAEMILSTTGGVVGSWKFTNRRCPEIKSSSVRNGDANPWLEH